MYFTFLKPTREPLRRIELSTSSLPRKCSTPELQQLTAVICYRITDYCSNERETRLEPATYSLEGYRSTNWATPAIKFQVSGFKFQVAQQLAAKLWTLNLEHWTMLLWGSKDSNLGSHKTTDLQSVPVGRFGTSPSDNFKEQLFSSSHFPRLKGRFEKESAKLYAFPLFQNLSQLFRRY